MIANLDRLIPTPGNDNTTAGGLDILNDADWSVVFCNLSGLSSLNIVHPASVVSSC